MERSVRVFLQTTAIVLSLAICVQAQPTFVTEVPGGSDNFKSIGELVYFTVGYALWRTDGTAEGTFELKTGFNGLAEFTEFNGKLFFKSGKMRQDGYVAWNELWASDGTSDGTVLLKRSTLYDVDIAGATTAYLFFQASESGTGRELYRSDGTLAGTSLVKDIYPGTPNGFNGSSAAVGSLLFFAGNDGNHGTELWKTDGSPAGTVMVEDINPGPGHGAGGSVFSYNNLFYFRGNTPETGFEPWVSDGTVAGTFMLHDVVPGSGGSGLISYKIANKGLVYFLIWPVNPDPYASAADLWKSSGTVASTAKIGTVGQPDGLNDYHSFTNYNGKVYFIHRYENFGDIIVSTDGSSIESSGSFDTPDGGINFFQPVKDHLIIAGHAQTYPIPFYRSDGGAPQEFYRLKSGGFHGADRSVTRPDIVKSGDLAFFADHDGPTDDDSNTPYDEQDYFHLFQTDGITTQSIRTIHGVSIPGVKDIADFNGKVIFTSHDDYFVPVEDFKKLWIYDPSPQANTGAGKLSVETWTGISGTHVSSIPVDSPPSSTSEITIFETPGNIGDNYGSRVRGYLIPPATGNYTFWISSDDRSELWLSTDEDPGNKKKIAEVAGWTTPRQWDKYTSQKSAPTSLVAGRKYYIEALLKEGTGGDHLAVGWQLPDGTMERPIPGSRLISFESTGTPPQACEGTGMIRQEFWTEVSGTRVSDIPVNEEPDFTHDLKIFEGPASPVGDNYGSRIRGYICPPASGNYIFWIAGDDQVELSLSTDDNPANKRRIAYHNGWTNKREWTKYATQQSAAINLQAGQRYYIEALMKEGLKADHVSVGWQQPNGSLERPIAGSHLVPFGTSNPDPGPTCAGTGTISVETWTGIDGTRVSSIPVDSPPDLTGDRNIFEAPTNIGSNFGSRFRGYVCVPTSGNYTFWIASDDHSELWLSTNNDPSNKRRIAYHTGWTSPRQWTKYSTQQSAPIALIAGQQYYIEALYKEDEGGDNMAVGWQLPDGTFERPIPGNRLSPFNDASSATAARMSTEEELYSQINVYPNPAKSGDPQLTISGYEGIKKTIETQIEIMNMTGEVVFGDRISCGGDCGSYLMNINKQLVPGVYLVRMKTNGVSSVKRLLVK